MHVFSAFVHQEVDSVGVFIIDSIEPPLALAPQVLLLFLSILLGYLCIPEPNVRWLYRCPEKTEL